MSILEKKNDLFQILFFCFLVLGLQFQISIHNTGGATGASNIFISEIVILGIGFFVTVIQFVFRKKFLRLEKLEKLLFLFLLLFGFYFVFTFLHRIFAGGTLTGTIFLPRLVISAAMLFLALSYFRAKSESIFKGLVLVGFLTSAWQIFIFIHVNGVIRGSTVLGNSNVYNLFMLMIIPIFFVVMNRYSTIWKCICLVTILFLPFILLVSGSRIAFLMMIVLFLSTLILHHKIYRRGKVLKLSLALLLFSLLTVTLLLNFGSSDTNANVRRSISIPNDIVSRLSGGYVNVANFLDFNELNIGTDDFNGSDDNNKGEDEGLSQEEKSAIETTELSNYYRELWNGIATEEITESASNFLLGTGVSVVSVPLFGLQSPHNFILQYMLPFGLIGTILSFGILFIPLLIILLKKNGGRSIVILPYFTVLLLAWNQPLLGNMIICYTLMMIAHAVNNLDKTNISRGRLY